MSTEEDVAKQRQKRRPGPVKLAREPKLPLPADAARVEKTAYLPPDLAAAAEAKRRGLGVTWSKYVCDLVRADVGATA